MTREVATSGTRSAATVEMDVGAYCLSLSYNLSPAYNLRPLNPPTHYLFIIISV